MFASTELITSIGIAEAKPALDAISNELRRFSRQHLLEVISCVALDSRNHANLARIEQLTHLAACHCEGGLWVTKRYLERWINRDLFTSGIARLEDPAEDCFVVKALTPFGEFIALGGLWEGVDAAIELLTDCIYRLGLSENDLASIVASIRACLLVSKLVLQRAGLTAWESEESMPRARVDFQNFKNIRSKRLTVLTTDDLKELGVSLEQLSPFLLNPVLRKQIANQPFDVSQLHDQPILQFGNEVVVSMPTSLCAGIRKYIIKQVIKLHKCSELSEAMVDFIARKIKFKVCTSSRHIVVPVPMESDVSSDNRGVHLLFQVGDANIVHFIILKPKGFDSWQEPGIGSVEFDLQDLEAVEQSICKVRNSLEPNLASRKFATFLVCRHLGEGFRAQSLGKSAQVVSWWDLQVLLSSHPEALTKLIFMLQIENETSQISMTHGDLLNRYAYFVKNHCTFVPQQANRSRPLKLVLGVDMAFELRNKVRKSWDHRCAMNISNSTEIVFRAHVHSEFPARQKLDIYYSHARILNGIRSFCTWHDQTVLWFTLIDPETQQALNAFHELWNGLEDLIANLLAELRGVLRFSCPAIEVILDAQQVQDFNSVIKEGELLVDLFLHKNLPCGVLKLRSNALKNFEGPTNFGERWLLTNLLSAITRLADEEIHQLHIEAAINSQFRNPGAKVLHVLASNSMDVVLRSASVQTYSAPQELIENARSKALAWVEPASDLGIQYSIDESKQIFKKSVTLLMENIVSTLRPLSRASVILLLLKQYESLLAERGRWLDTAHANAELHGIEQASSVWAEAEFGRAELGLSLRALIEAAVCESADEGSEAGLDVLDQSVANMIMLIEMATNCELLHHGFTTEGVFVYPNGAHSFNSSPISSFRYIESMTKNLFDNSAPDAEFYDIRSRLKKNNKNSVSELMRSAFIAEFGVSYHAFTGIIGILSDFCVQKGEKVFWLQRKNYLEQCDMCKIEKSQAEAFLNTFSLPRRSSWAPDFKTVNAVDVEPWTFERRLSISLKPILDFGDNLLISMGAVGRAFSYLNRGLQSGEISEKPFTSKEMKSYIGRMADKLGHDFSNQVAELLRSLGWFAQAEVKMTTLHAGRNPDFGDVDVLAWRADGTVLVIECKKLRRARTPSEIAEMCNKFTGKTADNLYKHHRRLNWLKNNSNRLQDFINIHTTLTLYSPMVMNAQVPMQFLKVVENQEYVNVENLPSYLARCNAL
jgi:hypothetical protein